MTQTKTLEFFRKRVEIVNKYYAYGDQNDVNNQLLEIANDLLDALQESEKANEWRDIESAPKDGTFILGYDKQRDAPAVITWRKPEFKWKHLEYGSTEQAPEKTWIVEADEEFGFIPTHWMPLPLPPKTVT